MPIDSMAKRMAVAHLTRTRVGVLPDATEPEAWRAAVALSYGGTALTPAVAGVGGDLLWLGGKQTFGPLPDILGAG